MLVCEMLLRVGNTESRYYSSDITYYFRYVAPVLASLVFLVQTSSELKRRERISFATLDQDRDIEKDIISTGKHSSTYDGNKMSSKKTRSSQNGTGEHSCDFLDVCSEHGKETCSSRGIKKLVVLSYIEGQLLLQAPCRIKS